MSALLEEHSSKKQRAAPPQRDKRHAGEDTLDDDDETTPPALAVELRTDGYRVAAMRQPAPLASEAKRARGAAKQPEPKPAFGELRPYGTAAAAALLRALDTKVLPRALAPGLAGVVRLRIVDRRPGGGGPREVVCRVGDGDEAAAAEPTPPRRIGAPLPRRSLADALDDDGGDDSDESSDAPAEEIVVAEPSSRRDVVDVFEPEEEAEEASVAALRARLAVIVDVSRAHGLAS